MRLPKRAIILSIRPEWADKILTGEKTMEVRKTRPRLETPFKCYIYATKCRDKIGWLRIRPGHGWQRIDGMVIAEFVCDEIKRVRIPQPAYTGKMKIFPSGKTGCSTTINTRRMGRHERKTSRNPAMPEVREWISCMGKAVPQQHPKAHCDAWENARCLLCDVRSL